MLKKGLFIFLVKVLCLSALFVMQGCIQPTTKVYVKTKTASKNTSFSVSSVRILNNQLVITGSSLQDVSQVKLKRSGFDEDFTPESVSATQVIANGTRLITVGVGQVFDLIISNASGAATFQVDFTLSNHSVALNKLATTGATAGQVIKFNGTDWAPASLTEAQIYLGTWNASNNIGGVPDLSSVSSTPGEYYIASHAGTLNSVSYAIGDWIISDGYQWQKIAASKTSVTSFQGRQGIVTLTPADYVSLINTGTNKITGSSINDLFDVNISSPSNGSVLKYNGSKWVVGTDNTGVTAGSIVNADISASAAIDQSKIANLTTDLAAFQSTSGLAAAVRAVTLTGLTSATGTVSVSDSILGAFGKLMHTQTDYVSRSSGASILTGTIAVGGTGMITVPTATGVTFNEVANVTYVTNAIDANGVWTKGATSSINYTAGNVGIGTTSPTAGLQVATAGAASKPGVLISGALYNGGNSTTNLPQIYYNNGTAPTTWSTDGTVFGANLGTSDTNANFLDFHNNGGDSVFKIDRNGTFTASYNGNVVNSLSVGTNGAGALLVTNATSVSDAGVSLKSTGAYRWSQSTTWYDTADLYLSRYSANTLRLSSDGTSGSANLIVNGSVGVGTSAPAAKLDVNGDLMVNSGDRIVFGAVSGTSVNYNNSLWRDASDGSTVLSAPSSGAGIRFALNGTAASTKMIVASDGKVGIGTVAPEATLHVVQNGSTDGVDNFKVTGGTGGNYFKITSNNGTNTGDGGYIGSPVIDTGGVLYIKSQVRAHAGITVGQTTLLSNSLGIEGGSAGGGFNINVGDVTYNGPLRIRTAGQERMFVSAAGLVGIGTTAPLSNLDVNGSMAVGSYAGTSAAPTNGLIVSGPVGVGTNDPSYDPGYSGTDTVALQVNGGQLYMTNISSGVPRNIFTFNAVGTNYGHFYSDGNSTNNSISVGGTGDLNTIPSTPVMTWQLSSGHVGIGTNTPGQALEVVGNIYASGTITGSSDRRLKRNIRPIQDALDKLEQIVGVKYFWIDPHLHNEGEQIGVIAQDVEKVFPQAVLNGPDGVKSVSYFGLVAPVIEAIKELHHKFKAIVSRVLGVEEKVELQKRQIASLKAQSSLRIMKVEADNEALKKENELIKKHLAKLERMILQKNNSKN